MKPQRQTGRQFTERDVQLMISNPVYAGVGIYTAMVPEERWIAAAMRAIKEQGANFWLDVQANIIDSLNLPHDKTTMLCTRFQKVYETAENDRIHEETLKGFLHDLRLLAAG